MADSRTDRHTFEQKRSREILYERSDENSPTNSDSSDLWCSVQWTEGDCLGKTRKTLGHILQLGVRSISDVYSNSAVDR